LRKNTAKLLTMLLMVVSLSPIILLKQFSNAEDTVVYIKPDGSVVPSTAPIQRNGNIYTLTGNINTTVIVEKSHITFDGNGFRIFGKGWNVTVDGLVLDNVVNVTVKHVNFSHFYWGVRLFQCSNIVLSENEMFENAYGIHPDWSNNSLVIRNKVKASIGGGVYLTNSFNITFENNLIISNSYYAMRITNSENCTLRRNVIAHNFGSGIHFMNSNNNKVYNNNLLNNTYDAVNTNSVNMWDDGYLNGGNYWGLYSGSDLFSGVNQDILGSDGIGDTPYIIDGKNKDRYPLTKPLQLSIRGDVNYDGIVDIFDITAMASVYHSKEGDERWLPQADLAPPYGTIDIFDLVTCASHYKEKFP